MKFIFDTVCFMTLNETKASSNKQKICEIYGWKYLIRAAVRSGLKNLKKFKDDDQNVNDKARFKPLKQKQNVNWKHRSIENYSNAQRVRAAI